MKLLRIVTLALLAILSAGQSYSAGIIVYPKFIVTGDNGQLLTGGCLYSYDCGTTDKVATCADNTCGSFNTNPITLDSRGEADVYSEQCYKLVLYEADTDGVCDSTPSTPLIWTKDNIFSPGQEVPQIDYIGNYADLATAVTSIGSDPTTLMINVATVIADGDTVIIPSTLTLWFTDSGSIDGVAGGGTETLTMNGGITADLVQVFGSNLAIDGESSRIHNVYVQWGGAVGDGSTDSTAGFIKMVNFASALKADGVRLIISRGLYILSDEIPLLDDMTIIGDGNPELFQTASSKHIFAINTPESDISIEGIVFIGLGSDWDGTTNEAGVYMSGSAFNVHIKRCTFSKFKDGILGSQGNGRIHIESCDLRNFSHSGLRMVAPTNVWIQDSYVNGDRAGIGDEVDGLVGIWLANAPDGSGDDGSRAIITSNTVENTSIEGIISVVSFFNITNNVVSETFGYGIVAEASKGVIDDGGGKDLVISSNTIGNTYGGIRLSRDPANASLNPQRAIITNNIIYNVLGAGNDGINLGFGGTTENIKHVLVAGNLVHTAVGNGVDITNGQYIDVLNNSFYNTRIGVSTLGSAIGDSTNITTKGNTVIEAQNKGISISTNTTYFEVSNNTIRDPNTSAAANIDGISLSGCTNGIAIDNLIEDTGGNMRDGIRNTGTDNVVQNNIEIGGSGEVYKELTIASGVITIKKDSHTVDTEASAASDDLDTINGGIYVKQRITLKAEITGRVVVIKNGTGNIKSGADISLDNSDDIIVLEFDGTDWLVVSFYDNGA